MENRVSSGYCVPDKGSTALEGKSTESFPLNVMGHHPHDHHRPLPSSPSSPLGGPSCNSRPNEVLGSNICQDDDKVAGATTAPAPAPEVASATTSSGAVCDKTFQPSDLSTTTTTALNSPGGMAGDLGFPFTWAQWKELERQAMIYKYMTASLPVPPDLLLPIAQSLSPAQNPHYSLGNNGSVYNLRLGLSSSNKEAAAAEPGRCKRTDGKKWRCSRDVAPHQKYCERHLNRGRPRSRKPVEVLVQPPPFDNNNNNNGISKKNRFDSHNLPNPSVLHSTASSHGLLRSNSNTVQPNGRIPLFLDRTDENLSDVSSYKELSRGFDWSGQELNLNPYTDFSNFSDEPLNLYPYTDFGAPEPEPDLISLQTQNRMETPRGFIDAWSKTDSNANKKPSSSVSSHSNKWPSSLTLSVAMAAGNALDEEMGHIETGSGNADSGELELHKANVSSWLSPGSYVGSAPGGPLAEMLRPNSMAACSDSSPSEVLQRTLLSLSDSSGCTSPAIGAVPEIMPFQWLN
ncbi:hypothetical protein RHSIM_Rhsim03G0214300 [Rhododendron simsii]|uniref:Growth-regulating factor n=1 Tax=Rhododendron simsii TaxID=118357 RepID=A0A834H786_RHOSS|nr:hypothetical protein RHSIM_Rhsim03G0214300 [Rhododendron simsii]